MDKEFVKNYLNSNGKYFPSKRLLRLGRILEESNASEYSIKRGFFNPLILTIIFWLFWPFQLIDRLVLKDFTWGIIKLITPIIAASAMYYSYEVIYYEDYFKEFNYACLGIIALWLLWTIIDGFTIYYRTKLANYKSVLNSVKVDSWDRKRFNFDKPLENTTINKKTLNSFDAWRRENPNKSINDFYREENANL